MRKSATDVRMLGLMSVFGDITEIMLVKKNNATADLKRAFGSGKSSQRRPEYTIADPTTVFGDSFRILPTDLEKIL